jgi:hypothetical protein
MCDLPLSVSSAAPDGPADRWAKPMLCRLPNIDDSERRTDDQPVDPLSADTGPAAFGLAGLESRSRGREPILAEAQ